MATVLGYRVKSIKFVTVECSFSLIIGIKRPVAEFSTLRKQKNDFRVANRQARHVLSFSVPKSWQTGVFHHLAVNLSRKKNSIYIFLQKNVHLCGNGFKNCCYLYWQFSLMWGLAMLIKLCPCPFQICHYFTIWATAIIHLACSLHPPGYVSSILYAPSACSTCTFVSPSKKEANVFLFLTTPLMHPTSVGLFFFCLPPQFKLCVDV